MNEFLQLIAKEVNRIFVKEKSSTLENLFDNNYNFIGLDSDIIFGRKHMRSEHIQSESINENESGKISKSGNLLVGFYCCSSSLLKLSIGSCEYMSKYVKEGQFIYAFNDESVIPLTNLSNCDVFIKFDGNIVPIYAWYPHSDYVINSKYGLWYYYKEFDYYIVYCKGMAGAVKDKTSEFIDINYVFEKGIELPNMYKLSKKRSAEEDDEDNYNNKRRLI